MICHTSLSPRQAPGRRAAEALGSAGHAPPERRAGAHARRSDSCCLRGQESRMLSANSSADESQHGLYAVLLSWGTPEIFPSLPEVGVKLWNVFKYHLTLISPFFHNSPVLSAAQHAKELQDTVQYCSTQTTLYKALSILYLQNSNFCC